MKNKKLKISWEDYENFMGSYRDHIRLNRGRNIQSIGEHFVELFGVKNKRLQQMRSQEKACEYIFDNYIHGEKFCL